MLNKVFSFPSYQFKLLQEEYELSDTDNAVKVHTDKPHLVSLGSGRLSTAVTILPLQEGTVTLQNTILPLQEGTVTLQITIMPLQEGTVTLQITILPLQEGTVT